MMRFPLPAATFIAAFQLLISVIIRQQKGVVATIASSKSKSTTCEGEVQVINDIPLGINPDTVDTINAAETMADFYYPCNSSNSNSSSDVYVELIVFGSAGPTSRKNYTIAGTEFAKRGYEVMVIDRVLGYSGFSTVLGWDYNAALEYAADNLLLNIDDDVEQHMMNIKVAYTGHSQGHIGVLFAVSEQCPMPFFCNTNDHIPKLDPRVKAAAGYGAIVYNRFGGGFDPTINNTGFPYLYVLGDGDSAVVEVDEFTGKNETIYQGSYDRQLPTKVMPLLENMDHYSIMDNLLENSGEHGKLETPSTRPREEQVIFAVDVIDYWIQSQFFDINSDDVDYCQKFEDQFPITECQEEYKQEQGQEQPSSSSLTPTINPTTTMTDDDDDQSQSSAQKLLLSSQCVVVFFAVALLLLTV